MNQSRAAASDDAFFNSRTGRRQRIFKAVLLLFEFGFGRSADAEFRNAAREFGQTLFQFFAVVIGIGVLDLTANLLDATGNRFARAATLDDGGVVFGDDDFLGACPTCRFRWFPA